MKLRNTKVTSDLKVRVITDYKGGMKVADILKRYDISQGTLYRILNEKV